MGSLSVVKLLFGPGEGGGEVSHILKFNMHFKIIIM